MSEATGFIKNYDLLKEDCKVDDLLDISETVEKFKARIDAIDKPAIMGLIGKFGSGKSTMLYQVQKDITDDVCWIDFEAWKYPERRDLWEGFVIEFARQIGQLKKTVEKIDGKSSVNSSVDLVSTIAENISGVPGLKAVGGVFKNLFGTSPLKRVYEIQELLTTLIKETKKDFIIVVEDIDRSGDAGIYFLETLKYFIRGLNIDKRVLVIVPIGNEEYTRNLESYNKCVDYFEFHIRDIPNFENFISSIFISDIVNPVSKILNDRNLYPDLYDGSVSQLNHLFLELFNLLDSFSLRMLKSVIRNANVAYKLMQEDGFQPDARMVICLEAMKYFYFEKDEKRISYFDNLRIYEFIPAVSIFAAFIHCIVYKRNSMWDDFSLPAGQIRFPSHNIIIHEDRRIDNLDIYDFVPIIRSRIGHQNIGYEQITIDGVYLKYLT